MFNHTDNETLNDVVNESISYASNEGIDFNYQTLIVSYNPTHKDKVDIPFENIPSKDITIIIPNGNDLNRYIAEVVMSKSKNAILLEGAICKLTTEEVNDIVLSKNSYFRKKYKHDFDSAYGQLCSYFEEMDKKHHGTFSRHFIKDSEMRNVLFNTLKVSPDRYARDSKAINGQDVLIIDDTISRGQTIKEACKIIQESYNPKSITVLTLLLKLY